MEKELAFWLTFLREMNFISDPVILLKVNLSR